MAAEGILKIRQNKLPDLFVYNINYENTIEIFDDFNLIAGKNISKIRALAAFQFKSEPATD